MCLMALTISINDNFRDHALFVAQKKSSRKKAEEFIRGLNLPEIDMTVPCNISTWLLLLNIFHVYGAEFRKRNRGVQHGGDGDACCGDLWDGDAPDDDLVRLPVLPVPLGAGADRAGVHDPDGGAGGGRERAVRAADRRADRDEGADAAGQGVPPAELAGATGACRTAAS